MSKIFETEEEEEIYVIDSNDRVEAWLSEYREKQIKKQERKKKKKVEDFLASIETDEEGNTIIPTDEEGNYLIPTDDDGNPLVFIDEEGNIQTDFVMPEEEDEEIPEALSESAEEILENARNEAQSIIEEAQNEAESIKEQAMEEGRALGYDEGVAQGAADFNDRQAALEAEYNEKLQELLAEKEAVESEVMDIVCEVLEKAFKVNLSTDKAIFLHHVDNILHKIPASKNYIIRACDKDGAVINSQKATLIERLGGGANIEVIIDPLMTDGQCMIESDGGTFNCGVDIKLSGLLKDLRLLSRE